MRPIETCTVGGAGGGANPGEIAGDSGTDLMSGRTITGLGVVLAGGSRSGKTDPGKTVAAAMGAIAAVVGVSTDLSISAATVAA